MYRYHCRPNILEKTPNCNQPPKSTSAKHLNLYAPSLPTINQKKHIDHPRAEYPQYHKVPNLGDPLSTYTLHPSNPCPPRPSREKNKTEKTYSETQISRPTTINLFFPLLRVSPMGGKAWLIGKVISIYFPPLAGDILFWEKRYIACRVFLTRVM